MRPPGSKFYDFGPVKHRCVSDGMSPIFQVNLMPTGQSTQIRYVRYLNHSRRRQTSSSARDREGLFDVTIGVLRPPLDAGGGCLKSDSINLSLQLGYGARRESTFDAARR
jgi:hypothetical protein